MFHGDLWLWCLQLLLLAWWLENSSWQLISKFRPQHVARRWDDLVFSNSDCFPCWSVCRRTMYLVIIPPHPFPSRLKWFELASCWNAALKLAHYTDFATVLPGWYCCVLWATDARFVQLSGLVRICWSLPWNVHHLLLQYTKAKGWKLQKWMNVFSVVVMVHVGVTSLRWGFSSIPWWLSAYGVMNCSAGLWKFERMVKPFGTAEASYQMFFLFFLPPIWFNTWEGKSLGAFVTWVDARWT